MLPMLALAYIPPGIGWCDCHEPGYGSSSAVLAFLVVFLIALGADVGALKTWTRVGLGSVLGALVAGSTYLFFVLPHTWGDHRFHGESFTGLLALAALVCAVVAGTIGIALNRIGRALHDTELGGTVYRRLSVPGRR
jgi:hypothetical protein